jgi:hypothetical protein
MNFLIGSGGSLVDQIENHRMYCLGGTVFTFTEGSSFTGSDTLVFVYTSLPAAGSAGGSFSLGSTLNGPYTYGILVDGSIQSFSSVMCIVAASGGFNDPNSWLGGVIPSITFCAGVGGCGLYIPTGIRFTTGALNGRLEIQFILITVSVGASFQLGDGDLEGSFRFVFSVVFAIYGEINILSKGRGGILLPFSSQFNCYPGSSVAAASDIVLEIYNPIDGQTVGDAIPVAVGVTEGFFVDVTESGEPVITTDREYHALIPSFFLSHNASTSSTHPFEHFESDNTVDTKR